MEPLSADDPRTVGEFALRARLGAGGMGQVYLGFSPAGRAVAIKVVHSSLLNDREFRERFGREVAAARAVSGMYTAPVVAAGLDDNPPWFATAFVPGPSLADVVGSHGPLPEAAVWRLAAGLTEALRAVHASGLVHRDLKPANVLLAADGPHVIDFGISRAFEGTSLTQTGMVVGTPGYMSPEQAEGQQAGPQSDVFSLGCVLAFAVAGTPPFGAGSAASVLYRVVTAQPDLGAVPPGLRQVIEACLNKNPAERVRLTDLASMISASGPATVATLGAFWPDPLSSIIAASQSYPAPTQAGPAAASGAAVADPAGPSPSFALSGQLPSEAAAPSMAAQASQAPASPPPASQSAMGYLPTATALGSTPPPASAAAAPGSGGQAGMVVDGYLKAATRSMAAGDPLAPSYPGQPATPQSYQSPAAQPATPPPPLATDYPATQQASWPQSGGQAWSQPGGTAQPGTPWGQPGASAASGAQYGASWPAAGGQQPATPWPAASSATPWPQQSTPAPWQQAGAPGMAAPLAQYTPGLRRPIKAEVPGPVLAAVRLMWTGLAFSVLELIFSLAALARYSKISANYPGTGSARVATDWAAVVGIFGLTASVIALVFWTWLAVACRGGRGWTRVAGTVLFGINSFGTLLVLFGSGGDPAVKVSASVVWFIGLITIILLWGAQASAFFTAWRKHPPRP